MEDFSSVLWVILVGGAALFSAFRSNAKKRQERPEKTRRAVVEAGTGQQGPTPPPLPANDKENDFSLRNSPVNKTASVRQSLNPAESETTEPVAETIEEFDLRKAVIYSEILKTRFED